MSTPRGRGQVLLSRAQAVGGGQADGQQEAVSARPAQWAPPASPGVEVRALSSRPASQAVTQETGQSRPRPQSAESQVQERQNVYLG